MDAIGTLSVTLGMASLALAFGSTFSGRRSLPLVRGAAVLAVGSAAVSLGGVLMAKGG